MTKNVISSAKTLLTAYRKALVGLEEGLGEEFAKAVDLMQGSTGHVVVCGMGKSGIIGRKISSSLASTGTPSLFLHPAEAIHGDLGMVRPGDVVLLISYSGSTEEIVRLLPAFGRLDARLIALTGNPHSIIAEAAEITLDISVDREACPLNLAPTTSSLNSLVLGDALAVALMETRGFAETDFANTHPGGTLGRRLLTRVRDKMCTENLPFVDPKGIGSGCINDHDRRPPWSCVGWQCRQLGRCYYRWGFTSLAGKTVRYCGNQGIRCRKSDAAHHRA